jgi:predicted Zn-ribbon and HTH transcriptional regulator
MEPQQDTSDKQYPHLNRSGRTKGVPNKATKTFRETITKLLSDNSSNVGVWLERVSQDDPAKALDLLAKLAEYAAPKLSKVEMQSDVSVTHGYAFRIERPEKEVNPALVAENSQSQIAPAIDQAEVIPLTRTAEKNPL